MHSELSTYSGGEYQSPPFQPGLLDRSLPTFGLYRRILATVFRASATARQGKYDDEQWRLSSLEILQAVEKIGGCIRIQGMDELMALDGPCVIVANHMSTLETFSLPAILVPHRRVTFVVKRSLTEYPVFRHIMRARYPIAVDRKNPREDLQTILRDGCQRIHDGFSVIIFPQTTRSVAFEPEHFNSIGVKLAKKAGVPIVPLALQTHLWGAGRYIRDFGPVHPHFPVHFAFGAPLPVTGNGQEQHQQILSFIAEKTSQWQQELPAPPAQT